MKTEITKAIESVEAAIKNLTAANKVAINENPMAAILIVDTIAKAAELRSRLALMESALTVE